MDKQKDLIDRILDIEQDMFSRVRSATPAPCQNEPDRFRQIRGSIYEAWNEEMLESYLEDLKVAQKKGRNLFSEKYARMDNLIPQLNTNPLIDKIVEVETKWQTEIRNKFPAVYNRLCRDASQAQDGSNFAVYLKCELETYSDKTIQLYYQHIKNALERGENMAISSLQRLVKKGGFNDLDHAENYLKNITDTMTD
ncbi:MAG: DUF4125 domain-containing protein [Deltaproteobacteria bacterium]|nr:MAG: DUF4125 domain-containing protein [Deltaproteobacteria bacterium]